MTTISIVIPARNPGVEILETIKSVLNQKKSPTEIIVFDNASNEDVQTILSNYPGIDLARVKFFRSDVSLNMGGSWTYATNLATSDWVILLPADDVLSEDAIEEFTKTIALFPDVDFIYSGMDLIIRNGVILRKPNFGKASSVKKNGQLLQKIRNSGSNPIGGTACVVFKNEVIKRELPWNSEISFVTDLEMYTRILQNEGFHAKINKSLAYFRVHGQSLTGKLGFQQMTQVEAFWSGKFLNQSNKLKYYLVITQIKIRSIARLTFQKVLGE